MLMVKDLMKDLDQGDRSMEVIKEKNKTTPQPLNTWTSPWMSFYAVGSGTGFTTLSSQTT